MYNTTAQYKEYIKKPSRDFECRVKMGNRTFTNTEVIEIVPETVQPNNGFSIGNTVSQSIDITLKNDGGVYAEVGIVDVEIGLKIGNTIEYIPIGTYNIDDVTKTDYTVKLTCYDNMIKFETGYFEKYENPTLQQVIEQLEETTGVKFEGTVPSYTVTKLSGYTCREILAYVASICGGNAFITRNGKFTIKAPTQVDYKITAANYFNTGYTKEDSTYKIGMITCQNKTNTDYTENEDYDSANDKNTISVGSLSSDTMELTFENPWVTENILNDIYSKLKDFSYLGYSMKWQGDMSLDVGDIVTVVDKNNIERKALIYANKLNYTGGLTAETSAKGETKNSNSFNASGNGISEIDRIAVKLLIAEKAIINKANIKDLEATNARIENLDANVAKINTALINYATIEMLNAVKANISDLVAKDAEIANALINKADITQLNAANANISKLDATVADIKTLVSGNLTSANIQSLVLTSSKVTVENGFIKNAMIESLVADKITSGTLNTNKLTIASNNGGLVLANNTIQFSDKDKNVRVQIGQDAKGDFNFIVKGTDGKTVLLDSTGLHEGAISDGLIKTDMVADAAITKNKVNYSSFIEGLNADSNLHYINASKIALDLDGQSLDIAFNKLSTSIENIEVGTENYILASAFQEDLYLNYWELNSLNSLEEYKNEKYECNSLVCNNTTNDWLESGQYINTLEKDTSYTLSFMANGEAYIYITEIAYDSNNNRNDYKVTEIEVSTDEYKKYKATFTTSSYIRYAYLTIATPRKKISKITLLQLERGIIDTDWSPAIADTEQIIGDIKSVTQTNTTSINVIQGKIETLISNTTITIDGEEKTLKDAYNGTVTDVNSIKTSIGEHTTKINQQTGEITSLTSRTAKIETRLDGFTANFSSIEKNISKVNDDINSLNKDLNSTNSNLSNINSTLNSTKNDLENTKNSLANAQKSLSTAQEEINSAKQSISSTQSDLNNAKNEIQANKNKISSAINDINTTKNNLLEATTEIESTKSKLAQLEITLDGFNTRVEEQISNIKIGTRNYLLFSTFNKNNYENSWDINKYCTLEAYLYKDNVYNALVCNNTTNDWQEAGQSINLIESELEYTFSAYVNGECNISIVGISYDSNNNRNEYTLSEFDISETEYTRIKHTFKTGKNTRYAYLTIATPRKSISKTALPKLEKGNIATDWTPAPEDINNDIDEVNSNIAIVENVLTETINTTKSEIKQTTDSISNSVSSLQSKTTTIEGKLDNKADISKVTEISSTVSSLSTNLNGITARTETLESKTTNLESSVKSNVSEISTLKDKISLKVEQTDINKAINTLDGTVQNSINSLSARIDAQAGEISSKVSANDVGTIITQSPTQVMTAFNNISRYFQVSADGAKFGDIASGDYTIMSSNGLQQHIGGANYDYLYVAYGQVSNVYVSNSTSSTVSVYVPYDSNLKTMLRGRKPKVCAILSKEDMYTVPPGYAYVKGGQSNIAFLTSWDTNGYSVNSSLARTIINMSSMKETIVYGGTNKITVLIIA